MEKILLIQLRQLGDILLTTPCIRELRRCKPRAEITFLCHPMGKKVLDDNPYLDRLICYHKEDSLYQQWKFLKGLGSYGFTHVLDFMNNPRSGLFCLFSKAPTRVSFESKRKFFYTDRVPREPGERYIVQEKFDLLNRISCFPKHPHMDLPWFSKDGRAVKKHIDAHPSFLSANLRIALSPTHRRPLRRWPLSQYIALADRLTQKYNAHVIWIWGPGEKKEAKYCQLGTQSQTFLAPPTSFRELAYLIANCHLFIGNSNGPSHIAVATKCPSLQLHGPTKAAAWCPLTSEHLALQRDPISEISVDLVMETLEKNAMLSPKTTAPLKQNWNEVRPMES